MARFLRNKVDGTIYDWCQLLSVHPKCEEVTEQEAYPERFLKKEVVEQAVQKRKGRPPLAQALDTNIEEPPYEHTDLDYEMTKIPFGGAGLKSPLGAN